jgi:hypothetical protein
LISKPTTKKKAALKPSLIHNRRGFDNSKLSAPMVNLICHKLLYSDAQGELAQVRARSVKIMSRIPLEASLRKNLWEGTQIRFL